MCVCAVHAYASVCVCVRVGVLCARCVPLHGCSLKVCQLTGADIPFTAVLRRVDQSDCPDAQNEREREHYRRRGRFCLVLD